MIFALIAIAILAALRFWASAEILARIPAPFGPFVLHFIGVALIVAVAILLDRLIRFFYWNGYLRRHRKRDTPALVEDVVTALLIVVGLSVGLYFEEGLSVTGLVTASGATAIILGIALQAVIQDLFSGLSINFDGSYALGEWLTVYSEQLREPVYGCVSGITWRTTFLTLEDGRRLMVPNHMMTANPVLNHSRPREPKRLSVEVCVDNRIAFDRVIDMLLGEAFKAVRQPGLARDPEPDVILNRLTQDGVYYEVRFYAYPYQISPTTARSIVMKALLDVIQQNSLAWPVQQVELTQAPSAASAPGEKEARGALSRASLFANVLNDEQLDGLARQSKRSELPRGAVLMRQGEAPSSMFIILEGAVSIAIAGPDGSSHEVAVSATGDVVGEMSLMTGAPRTATATALARLRVLEIGKEAIEGLLRKSPELAERLSHTLARRQHELDELAHRASRKENAETDILSRMMAFFSRAFSATE
jgi:small-conductance mechanosensitive channel/CRP-like cAMP-binding protein